MTALWNIIPPHLVAGYIHTFGLALFPRKLDALSGCSWGIKSLLGITSKNEVGMDREYVPSAMLMRSLLCIFFLIVLSRRMSFLMFVISSILLLLLGLILSTCSLTIGLQMFQSTLITILFLSTLCGPSEKLETYIFFRGRNCLSWAFCTRSLILCNCIVLRLSKLKTLEWLGLFLAWSSPVGFFMGLLQIMWVDLDTACTWMSHTPSSLRCGWEIAPTQKQNWSAYGLFCLPPKWWGFPYSMYLVTLQSS